MPGIRNARIQAYRTAAAWGVGTKVAVATGFAGFLALLSQVSIPVRWTPVPLTLQLLGVFLIGTCLGARYGVLSIAIYLLAGALGLHVFAPSPDPFNVPALVSSSRWHVLLPDLARHTGFTAGYLIGFLPATALVGWHVRRASEGRPLASNVLRWIALALAFLLVSASGAVFFLLRGHTLSSAAGAASSYSATLDGLWVFLAAGAIVLPAVAWLVFRHRGGSAALDLYLVLLGAIAIIHLCGVLVLVPTLGWTWTQGVALGSTVFLPFDALKAGIAVSLSLPFLPARHHLAPTPEKTA